MTTCVGCGYPLPAGHMAACPECGVDPATSRAAQIERDIFPVQLARIGWTLAFVAVVCNVIELSLSLVTMLTLLSGTTYYTLTSILPEWTQSTLSPVFRVGEISGLLALIMLAWGARETLGLSRQSYRALWVALCVTILTFMGAFYNITNALVGGLGAVGSAFFGGFGAGLPLLLLIWFRNRFARTVGMRRSAVLREMPYLAAVTVMLIGGVFELLSSGLNPSESWYSRVDSVVIVIVLSALNVELLHSIIGLRRAFRRYCWWHVHEVIFERPSQSIGGAPI
ncbi:MAG: hypothetical protein JNL80_01395 [Phycisphaerae bacterium]|jgi:hypothetical protein|nr:hypothetical protein [Phycisphaerae bacterium]